MKMRASRTRMAMRRTATAATAAAATATEQGQTGRKREGNREAGAAMRTHARLSVLVQVRGPVGGSGALLLHLLESFMDSVRKDKRSWCI